MSLVSFLRRVMAGLDPAIQDRLLCRQGTAWMLGTSPGMTAFMTAEIR